MAIDAVDASQVQESRSRLGYTEMNLLLFMEELVQRGLLHAQTMKPLVHSALVQLAVRFGEVWAQICRGLGGGRARAWEVSLTWEVQALALACSSMCNCCRALPSTPPLFCRGGMRRSRSSSCAR